MKAQKGAWLKIIWVSLKDRSIDFNPKENSLLNACVFLRSENIVATLDLLLNLALLRDEQRLSVGELVGGR